MIRRVLDDAGGYHIKIICKIGERLRVCRRL